MFLDSLSAEFSARDAVEANNFRLARRRPSRSSDGARLLRQRFGAGGFRALELILSHDEIDAEPRRPCLPGLFVLADKTIFPPALAGGAGGVCCTVFRVHGIGTRGWGEGDR